MPVKHESKISPTDTDVKRKIGDRLVSPEIGQRVKALRQSLRLDQKGLAEAVGAEQNTISDWENGKYLPSSTALIALGHLAGTEKEWWYTKASPASAARLRSLAAGSVTDSGVDREALIVIIEAVNQELIKRRLTLPDRKYATLVALFYELYHKAGQLDADMLEEVLKLVS